MGTAHSLERVRAPWKHPHTRIESEENAIDPDDGNSWKCSACTLPIFSTPFTMKSGHFLHDRCANLPKTLNNHVFHLNPLQIKDNWGDSSEPYSCDKCRSECGCFYYECTDDYLCNLRLDLLCSVQVAILHRSHEHRLMVVRGSAAFICGACGTQHPGLSAPSFYCTACAFWIHKDCASLPNAVRLLGPKKHRHSLFLMYNVAASTQGCKCQVCGERLLSLGAFMCLKCRYFVHIRCATSDPHRFKPVLIRDAKLAGLLHLPMADERSSIVGYMLENTSARDDDDDETEKNDDNNDGKEEEDHVDGEDKGKEKEGNDEWGISHKHPLIFHEEEEEEDDDDDNDGTEHSSRVCNACVQLISPPFYTCSKCPDFLLHSSCANLPTKKEDTIDDVEDEEKEKEKVMAKEDTVDDDDDDHDEEEEEVDDDDDDDGDGDRDDETEKNDDNSIDDDDEEHEETEKVMAKEDTVEDDDEKEEEEEEEEGEHVVDDDDDDNNEDEDEDEYDEEEEERKPEILHKHPLIFHEEEEDDDDDDDNDGTEHSSRVCNACVQLISPPFYTCSKCPDFLLHSSCANLPTKIKHPFHQEHTLFLSTKPPYPPFEIGFYCKGCGLLCNGFAYRCKTCGNFSMDVLCALMPPSITHQTHGKTHILYMSPSNQTDISGECSCCNFKLERLYYKCTNCRHLKLHARCALLPTSLAHKFDKHPLKLITSTKVPLITNDEDVDGDDDEGRLEICEVCEEGIRKHTWYYSCKDCEMSLHVNCIPFLDSFSRVKFGIRVDCNFHDCPLTLVPENSVAGHFCDYCNEKFVYAYSFGTYYFFGTYSSYECSKCNYRIHPHCAFSKTKERARSWNSMHIYLVNS